MSYIKIGMSVGAAALGYYYGGSKEAATVACAVLGAKVLQVYRDYSQIWLNGSRLISPFAHSCPEIKENGFDLKTKEGAGPGRFN